MKISNEVFEKLTSLDDLINLMRYDRNGMECHGIGEPEAFKYRLSLYKRKIEQELPDFTVDDILKISENFNKLKDLFGFVGSENMLAALEYEQRSAKPDDKLFELLIKLEFKQSVSNSIRYFIRDETFIILPDTELQKYHYITIRKTLDMNGLMNEQEFNKMFKIC